MSLMQLRPNYFYQIYSEKIQTDFQVPYLESSISGKKNLTFKASTKVKNCTNKNFFNLNQDKGIYCKKDQLKAVFTPINNSSSLPRFFKILQPNIKIVRFPESQWMNPNKKNYKI